MSKERKKHTRRSPATSQSSPIPSPKSPSGGLPQAKMAADASPTINVTVGADEATEGFFTRTLPVGLASTIGMLMAGLLGLGASIGLVLSELAHLKNPQASLGCDLNPLVGCSSSLGSWQAHLFFGVPNALLGTVAFTALLTISVWVAVTRLVPAWLLRATLWALLGACVVVAFFIYHSLFTFHALCPFCMLTWLATFLALAEVGGVLSGQNELKLPAGVQAVWARERYLLLVLLLGILVLICGFMLADRLALVL